ncbi:MAG: class I adenylate-forming enzyme family protein [Woeseiaceae bacterium]|nr:class I adenylate-forming enzyme family protein [Woeseiaceae bacterium]
MNVDLSQVRIQATTLGDLLLTAADQNSDTAAVVLPDKRISYGELVDRAMHRAKSLRALGVGPGDHVGLLLPTSMDFVESMFAIAMLGAVTVPINARYQPPELAYVIENADLVAVLTTDEFDEAVNFVERLHAALPGLGDANATALSLDEAPKLNNIVVFGSTESPGTLSQADFEARAADTDEAEVHLRRLQTRLGSTALILYTSGTTANPKGCMISHEAMVRNSMALADRYELTADDSFWSPLPMFHIAAILPLAASMSRGGTYITTPHFKAGEALATLEKEKVTCTYPCFWTIMGDLINHENFEKTDLSRVRLMNANFAVQPAVVGEKMEAAMPDTVYVGTFGMTETAGTVTTSRVDDTRNDRFTRLGVPLAGLEIKVIDEDGNALPAGERGEALIRGYSLFDRYYKAPDKTAEALDEDGWFHSGDMCSIHDNGQVMFHGRIKDMLKVGGENVAAVEIESCLQQHDAVKLAQVVGVPDARLQEVPAAFVEFNEGADASEEELIAFCKGKISNFKVPRYVRPVSEWPQSSTKIQKFKLQEQIVAELGLG